MVDGPAASFRYDPLGATVVRRQSRRLSLPDDDLRRPALPLRVRVRATARPRAAVDVPDVHVPARGAAAPGVQPPRPLRVRARGGGADGRRAVPRVLPAVRSGRRGAVVRADAVPLGGARDRRVSRRVRCAAGLRVGRADRPIYVFPLPEPIAAKWLVTFAAAASLALAILPPND